MKAAQIEQYGESSSLSINAAAPRPVAGDGQVLIEVNAASVNPVDTMVGLGYMHEMAPLSFPATLGVDVAGKVVEVGPGVEHLNVGDSVFGGASLLAGGSGAFAEFAAAVAGQLAKTPAGTDHINSAALPLTGVSAVQAVYENLKVQPGQTVLIHGGAGGIGTIAIQLAKHIGAAVTTTVLPGSEEYVRSLGADHVVTSRNGGFELPQGAFDSVYDTLGGDVYSASFGALRRGGTIVSMLAQPDEELAQSHGVTAIYQLTDVNSTRLEQLAGLVQEGAVTIHVAQVFPFEQIREAFALRESGQAHGKVVVELKRD